MKLNLTSKAEELYKPEMVFTYTMRTSYPLTYICELDGAEPRTTEELINFIERLAVKEGQSVLETLTELDFVDGDIIEVDVELR